MQALRHLTADDLNALSPHAEAERLVGNGQVTVLDLLTEYSISHADHLWLLEQPSLTGATFRAKLYELLAAKKNQKLGDRAFNEIYAKCLIKTVSEDESTRREANEEMKFLALRAAYGYRESDGSEYLPDIVALINKALAEDFFY